MAMGVRRNAMGTFLNRAKRIMGPFDTFLVGGDTAEVSDIKFSNDGKSMLLTTTNSNIYVLDAYCGEKLLAAGEITPGITGQEFVSRRKKLLELLPEKSLVIMASAPVKMMTDVVPYRFRQDAVIVSYLYFTGCQQPGGIAILNNDFGLCMFMPDSDPEDEIWHGQVAGTYAALNTFKADRTFSISRINEILPNMIRKAHNLYHNERVASSCYVDLPEFKKALSDLKVSNLCQYTHEARWIKSPSEIRIMRQSASITCQQELYELILDTANECLKLCKPGVSLHQIHSYSDVRLHRFLPASDLLCEELRESSNHGRLPIVEIRDHDVTSVREEFCQFPICHLLKTAIQNAGLATYLQITHADIYQVLGLRVDGPKIPLAVKAD